MNRYTYSVHRHETPWVTIAPPTMGANTGPAATASAYPTIAFPRWVASQMSANAPPVQMMGAAPKKPHQNRVMIMPAMSFEAPVAKEKIAATKHGAMVGHFLPYISDKGAHTSGPKPKLFYWSARKRYALEKLFTQEVVHSCPAQPLRPEYHTAAQQSYLLENTWSSIRN
jgi:hypothetical protein